MTSSATSAATALALRERIRTLSEWPSTRRSLAMLVVVLERLGDQVDGPREGEHHEDDC